MHAKFVKRLLLALGSLVLLLVILYVACIVYFLQSFDEELVTNVLGTAENNSFVIRAIYAGHSTLPNVTLVQVKSIHDPDSKYKSIMAIREWAISARFKALPGDSLRVILDEGRGMLQVYELSLTCDTCPSDVWSSQDYKVDSMNNPNSALNQFK